MYKGVLTAAIVKSYYSHVICTYRLTFPFSTRKDITTIRSQTLGEMPAPYLEVPRYGVLPLYIPLFFLSLICKLFFFLKFCYLHRQTLSSVPGPKWAAWTRFWIVKTLASGDSATTFVEINKRYGGPSNNERYT